MTDRYPDGALDLSLLPRPAAIETISQDAILDARMADLVARFTAAGVTYDVPMLESDPAKILQEEDTFREALVRQRIDDAIYATSLAYADGPDLDVRAADFATRRAAGELDPSLRRRAQLAYENLSVGGSYGGYEYQARAVSPVEIADCVVYGHEVDPVPKGEVRIALLGANSSGVASDDLLARVQARFAGRGDRKVNDVVNVVSADVVTYAIDATLVLRRGAQPRPDPAPIRDAQYIQVLAYAASRRAIGATVTFAGLASALGGGQSASYIADVEIHSPFAGVEPIASVPPIGGGPFQAPVLTGVTLDYRVEA